MKWKGIDLRGDHAGPFLEGAVEDGDIYASFTVPLTGGEVRTTYFEVIDGELGDRLTVAMEIDEKFKGQIYACRKNVWNKVCNALEEYDYQ